MFIIVLVKFFLGLAATSPFAPVMTEVRSNTNGLKFPIPMASSWNFLVRHVTIAYTSAEA